MNFGLDILQDRKILLPLTGIETCKVWPIAYDYTDWAVHHIVYILIVTGMGQCTDSECNYYDVRINFIINSQRCTKSNIC